MAVTLPPVPELATVTSESLQSKIRELLPSQMGFGTDLVAQNVIVPIVDLTATAEGSGVRQDLQTALAFGSQTTFQVANTTSTIINTTGFFRVFGAANLEAAAGGQRSITFYLSDGVTDKLIISFVLENTASGVQQIIPFDFVVFLAAGQSLKCTSTSNQQTAQGSTRQIADINGVFVNPSGFSPS